MNDIETTVLATLPNGSTLHRVERHCEYIPGSVLLLNNKGQLLVGPISALDASDAALSVLVEQTFIDARPPRETVLAIAVAAMAVEAAIREGAI